MSCGVVFACWSSCEDKLWRLGLQLSRLRGATRSSDAIPRAMAMRNMAGGLRSALGLFLALAIYPGEASNSSSSCSGCDIEDWNDEQFAQCNFWGDPHITSSYGDLGSFDFQGLGLWKASVSSACGYKFQVNAFTCRYTPQLWSNSITRYLAIQIGDKIIYVNNTNVGKGRGWGIPWHTRSSLGRLSRLSRLSRACRWQRSGYGR